MTDFKKLAEEFDSHQKRNKPLRVTRTLKLNNENYVKLQNYCSKRSLHVSDVVDRLILEFLAHASNPLDDIAS